MKHRQMFLFCVVTAMATVLSGCGYGNPLDRQAVSGAVIVDGQPLPRGSIDFTSCNRQNQASVRTGAVITAGKYNLPVEKGLPPGEYMVSIRAVERTENPNPNALPGSEPLTRPKRQKIPPQYNFKTTLVREVTADGTNTFDFNIKTN